MKRPFGGLPTGQRFFFGAAFCPAILKNFSDGLMEHKLATLTRGNRGRYGSEVPSKSSAMPIRPCVHPGAFEPEAIAAMGALWSLSLTNRPRSALSQE